MDRSDAYRERVVDAVLDAFSAKSISSLDMADYLDNRFDQLPKLERAPSA